MTTLLSRPGAATAAVTNQKWRTAPNYGTRAGSIGHVLLHAVRDSAASFDAKGNLKDLGQRKRGK